MKVLKDPAFAVTRRRLLCAGAAAGAMRIAIPPAAAETMHRGYAMEIAEAVAALPQSVPDAVADRTIWTVIDNFGAMLYANTLPDAVATADYFARSAAGRSVEVLTAGFSSSATGAAAAMSYLVHAAEIDDTDPRGELRASAVVMPACLASAQAADATGAAFLRAAALGLTLQGRLARPVGPVQRFGWMASGVWGPPAAAAAVSLLHRQPPETMAAAISLAGAAAGGVFQYYFDQTDEKRIIVARAARAAVESAELAGMGEHGAGRVIEGNAGLYRIFTSGGDAPVIGKLTDNLSRLEGPLHLRPKFFAASHSIIPTLEGLQRAAPPDLDPSAVESFVVRGNEDWARILADKINQFEAPDSRIGAALNFSYVIALWLAERSVLPGDYNERTLNDARILSLAAAGVFETNDSDHLSIEIRMRNGGAIHADALDPDPDAPAPLDEGRRLEKFTALAGTRLDNARVRALLDHCQSLKDAESMKDWAARAQELCAPR